MRKRDKGRYAKLLEAWRPTEGAGDPVGCVATSFTFSAAFFEEDCLGRFLGMESDPDEDAPAWIVEREEKMRQVSCAAALVDATNCRGTRNPRWDLVPIRVGRGILHAKVSVLRWRNLVRLIVASANLTEDGYRNNREVFGVLEWGPRPADAASRAGAPRECLIETIRFLRDVLGRATGGSEAPETRRCREFLAGVSAQVEAWPEPASRRGSGVHPVFAGPGRRDVLGTMGAAWPWGVRPETATVVSPFFEKPGAENLPARRVWDLLRARGRCGVRYRVTAEDVPGSERVMLHAPGSLRAAKPDRAGATVSFARLPDEPARPFHMKAIRLESESSEHVAYLIGSSNFTAAGLGLRAAEPGGRANLEANLLYLADGRDPEAMEALDAALPPAEEVRDPDPLWQPLPDRDDEAAPDRLVLPPSFRSATLVKSDCGGLVVRLTIDGRPPEGFAVGREGDGSTWVSEADWSRAGRPAAWEVPWADARAPSGFVLTWPDAVGSAWWPVNVADGSVLPPPDLLRDLSLDRLVEVLASARPLHQIARRWLERDRAKGGGPPCVASDLDPLRRVDETGFLLRRTRRLSEGLRGLRERLERPTPSESVLQWRLDGPIGVNALEAAIRREARSATEADFLIAETALGLARIRPKPGPGCLDPTLVRREILRVAERLIAGIVDRPGQEARELRDYVRDVEAEVRG